MKYIDLGLSSGTLWCDTNEEGFFTFDDAVKKYGNGLPTWEQLDELKTQCKWEWIGNECKVTGHNGNYIILPAAGFHGCDGGVHFVGSYGYYWSSTPFDLDYAWRLNFYAGSVSVLYGSRCYGGSVRLVK